MWTIFQGLYWVCYNIASGFFAFVFWPWAMWDLSSLTRDSTHDPCVEKQILNHWASRHIPVLQVFYLFPHGPCLSLLLFCPWRCFFLLVFQATNSHLNRDSPTIVGKSFMSSLTCFRTRVIFFLTYHLFLGARALFILTGLFLLGLWTCCELFIVSGCRVQSQSSPL